MQLLGNATKTCPPNSAAFDSLGRPPRQARRLADPPAPHIHLHMDEILARAAGAQLPGSASAGASSSTSELPESLFASSSSMGMSLSPLAPATPSDLFNSPTVSRSPIDIDTSPIVPQGNYNYVPLDRVIADLHGTWPSLGFPEYTERLREADLVDASLIATAFRAFLCEYLQLGEHRTDLLIAHARRLVRHGNVASVLTRTHSEAFGDDSEYPESDEDEEELGSD
jgi:hypothetical protein